MFQTKWDHIEKTKKTPIFFGKRMYLILIKCNFFIARYFWTIRFKYELILTLQIHFFLHSFLFACSSIQQSSAGMLLFSDLQETNLKLYRHKCHLFPRVFGEISSKYISICPRITLAIVPSFPSSHLFIPNLTYFFHRIYIIMFEI